MNSDTGYPLRIHQQNSVLSIFANAMLTLAARLFLSAATTHSICPIPSLAVAIYRYWVFVGCSMSEGTNQSVNAYHRRPSATTKLIVIHVRLLSHVFQSPPPSGFQMPRKNNVRGRNGPMWCKQRVVVEAFLWKSNAVWGIVTLHHDAWFEGDNESRWCARVALPSSTRGGLVVDVSPDDDLLIILCAT